MMIYVSVFACVLSVSFQALGAGFIDHVQGVPYKWSTSAPITINVDNDATINTGGTITNAAAVAILTKAFQTWEQLNVGGTDVIDNGLDFNTASIQTIAGGIDETNYQNYIRIGADGLFENVAPNNNGVYVIFDRNGLILNALFSNLGSGQILGLASPGKYNASTKRLEAGFVIINGAYSGITPSSIAYTATHEIGHLLNLSHSQLNHEEGTNISVADDDVVPLMFPYITDKAFSEVDPNVYPGLAELDDELALAFLYPNGTALNTRGSIRGKIKRRLGGFARGVEVICRNETNGREKAVSWISDQTYEGQGEYYCGNLDAGTHTVAIEPIELAINEFDPVPPFIPSEFYNGATESYSPLIDDPSSAAPVSVTLGQTTDEVNFILNETGRLTSGTEVTAVIEGSVPDLQYFISVPASATSLTIQLSSAIDLDLYARCGDEFSLTQGVTSPPFYDPSGASQQAEFFSNGNTGNETITIDRFSTPALKACTYQIVVNDYLSNSEGSPENFTLKATVNGAKPQLIVSKSDTGVQTTFGSEFLVAKQTFSARSETFNIHALTFYDVGSDGFATYTAARLYQDTDGNGVLTDADTFVAQTAIDGDNRKIEFTSLDEIIQTDTSQGYFVTYTSTTQAGFLPMVALTLLSMLVMAFIKPRGLMQVLSILFLSMVISTCSSSEVVSGYAPQLNSGSSVDATGLTFGSNVRIDLDIEPVSVEDFFN